MSSGLPCVLLRGLTREARHWGAFPALLRERLNSAPVIALDLPGNGRLHAQRSPMEVASMAAHCRAALAEQGHAPPYRVVAMSLGAMVALAWAEHHPGEVAAAVLINTSLRGASAFHQRLRPACYPTLLRLAATDPQADPGTWERAILRMTSHRGAGVTPGPGELSNDALLNDWTTWRREAPVSRANALRQLIAAARYRLPAQPPGPPLLVLASARDALVDPRCSRRLAQAWHLPIAEHPSAGHDLPLDDAPWVVEHAARFFAEAASA